MKDSGVRKFFVIVTYDIVKTKKRTRVMKLLKGSGYHVQKSVFECFLDEGQLEFLRVKLSQEIDEEHDSVRIYRIPDNRQTDVEILGVGEIPEEAQLTII